MICREKPLNSVQNLCSDLVIDDIVLSDFDDSSEQLQHLINIDCALALSVCKSRNLPSCVFVLSLLYMKRLRALQSSSSLIEIDQLTTKELYLIATLLADKYLIDEGEDEQLFNSELGQLTGISCQRVNLIERQVLIALNWNLFVSNSEFEQFFSLFKRQMRRKPSSNEEIDDPEQFYQMCLKFVPQILEYLALTSLVLLGSTISVLTAAHLGIATQSTLMKTLHPSTSTCFNPSFENNATFIEPISIQHTHRSWSNDLFNETTSESPIFAFDLHRSNSMIRSLIETVG